MLQSRDLVGQLALPGPQVLQRVGLRVGEDLGDLVQGKAQFAVEEDLLEPCQVDVFVVAVPGPAAATR
ncbi:hypothetical protein GCM10010336_63810 [Streptomyces goshikiensis]|nr:hypothetical protein GCM10010336_63810 [Streptomyces goshikiensis]